MHKWEKTLYIDVMRSCNYHHELLAYTNTVCTLLEMWSYTLRRYSSSFTHFPTLLQPYKMNSSRGLEVEWWRWLTGYTHCMLYCLLFYTFKRCLPFWQSYNADGHTKWIKWLAASVVSTDEVCRDRYQRWSHKDGNYIMNSEGRCSSPVFSRRNAHQCVV